MTEQAILEAVQEIFRDNFDDDTLEITRATCADDIEDWDSLEQINLLTAIEKKFNIKFKLADVRNLKPRCPAFRSGWPECTRRRTEFRRPAPPAQTAGQHRVCGHNRTGKNRPG
jgi:acyl carrier protein